MLYVIKKDGTREEFNPQKIVAFCPGACGFPWKE